MQYYIDRRKIIYKIVFGYLLALSLMVGIVVFSFSRLNDIKQSVDDITSRLSVARSLSQNITAQIRLVRFYGERYRRSYRQEDLDQFNTKLQDLKDGLNNISQHVRNDSWQDMIRYIQQQTLEYEREFRNIAQLIMYQQALLSTVFLKQELLIENQLSAIRINVGIVQVPEIFFSFGNARNAFQLMRLYQAKYIYEADEKYYVMFKSNYKQANQAFIDLDRALQVVPGDSHISGITLKANEALKVYFETFLQIRRASLGLKKSAVQLDHHELEVTDTASEIAAAIEGEYSVRNDRMQKLVLSAQIELVVAMTIAVLLSIGLIFIVSRKITAPIFQEMQREAEELKIARDKAEIAHRVKSEFLAHMSHELRTPLNAIIGFSELLSLMSLDARRKSFVGAIHTAGKGLLMLINNILDLSKIEAGKVELSPSVISLKRVLEDIEQIFSLKVQEKLLKFSIHHSENLPEFVEIDEIRFRQILLNLIGNAIKFTEEGEVTVEARCVYRSDSRVDLFITVSDTGIGIAEEEQKNVFKSFEQQSQQDANKYGGTGLGLSISRQLIELMQGKIVLTSTPGKGSRFEVEIPGLLIAEDSKEKIPAITRHRYEKITFPPVRVLVADDIHSNRTFFREVLSEIRLEVLSAEDGLEAIQLAKKYLPTLIFMDIRMPKMNGIEAMLRLKDDPKTAEIPVIAITASATAKEGEMILSQGFDGFLCKPVEISSIINEVSRFVEPLARDVQPSAPVEVSTLFTGKGPADPCLLVSQLQNDILPTLHSLKKAFVVSEFAGMATRLAQIGDEHKLSYFSDCAFRIEQCIDTFDMKGMNDVMQRLTKIVEKVVADLEVSGEK